MGEEHMNFTQSLSRNQVSLFVHHFFTFMALTVFVSNSYAATKDKQIINLSPKGQAILEEKLNSYPAFELEKATKEAKKKFPLTKEGTQVTLTYRRNQVKGSFRGLDSKSVLIGSKRVPKMDLPQQQLAKFDKKINAKLRQIHVERIRAGYNSKKMLFEQKLIKPLLKQYPPVSKTLFAKVFRKIQPPSQAEKYNEEIIKLYDDSLPIPEDMSKKRFLRKTLSDFLKKNDDLALDGDYVISLVEKRKKDEANRKAEEARLKRLANRIDYPRTATPIFSPDGGPFSSRNRITITSSTEGAKIHYTTNGDTPTDKSPIFKEPISLEMNQRLKAVAFHPEYNDSDTAIVAPFLKVTKILCFITSNKNQSYVNSFNVNIPRVLRARGHKFDSFNRSTLPKITSSSLRKYGQMWILSTTGGKKVFDESEVNAIYNFHKRGGGLFIVADHVSYCVSANQIAKKLGVEFYGSIDRNPFIAKKCFSNHSLFEKVNKLSGVKSEGNIKKLNKNVKVVASNNNIPIIAILDDAYSGRVVFDTSFVKLFDNMIQKNDNVQYIENIADWLTK
jgi:chitobiase/beta-hexosaminidase-like protein